MDARLPWAVRNNARWCDLVCRSHRIQTRFRPDLWATAQRAPQFYPDAITLRSPLAEEDVLGAISPGPGASVKDSFATLDLGRPWVRRAVRGPLDHLRRAAALRDAHVDGRADGTQPRRVDRGGRSDRHPRPRASTARRGPLPRRPRRRRHQRRSGGEPDRPGRGRQQRVREDDRRGRGVGRHPGRGRGHCFPRPCSSATNRGRACGPPSRLAFAMSARFASGSRRRLRADWPMRPSAHARHGPSSRTRRSRPPGGR